jgi:hypothetical protein
MWHYGDLVGRYMMLIYELSLLELLMYDDLMRGEGK